MNGSLLRSFVSCALLVLFCGAIETIDAQWSSDPAVNTPITATTGDQMSPRIASDGAGGAIIVWQDFRNGNNDIYAQRIDAAGVAQWASNGVAICTATNEQQAPTITSDGSGGAIMTWQDRRSSSYNIYAQRVNSSGVVQWTANGVSVASSASQLFPVITSDGSGGAIMSWNDNRPGVFIQRVDASGTVRWTANGVQLSLIAGPYDKLPAIVSDGSGGAVIAWNDYRSGTELDMYAQRVDSLGAIQWTANGVAVSTAASSQNNAAIVRDGAGGVVIAWNDYRSGTSNDIYAQRLNASGTPLWTADGVALCTATDDQLYHSIVGDNAGGAVVVWRDHRTGTRLDIYAQRVDGAGAVQWTSNGIAVCTIAGDKYVPSIVTDGSGGTIIAWDDLRTSGAYGIYAQRYDAAGAAQWTANGVRASTTAAAPYMIDNGSGGAIITTNSFANGNYDVCAQLITGSAALPVELVSFSAQHAGASTELRWTTASEVNNYGFEVERRIQDTGVRRQEENGTWASVGFVAGAGTTNAPKDYTFLDKNLKTGKYLYRLKQIDRNGKFTYSQEVEVMAGQGPNVFELSQNYPNPFNPSTVISYQLAVSSDVTLKVYDVLGREVTTLVNEKKNAGVHSVRFDASALPGGAYFYSIRAGTFRQTRTLLVLK